MTTAPDLATANLADIAPGTHLCAFYDSDEQLARIASAFVARGLAAGDRLLYIAADDDAATSMLGSLLGDDPRCHALASGQLEIQSFGDTYGDVHAGDLAPHRGRLPRGRGAGPHAWLPRPAGGCRDGRLRPLPRLFRRGDPLGAALDGDAARPRRDLGLPVRPASPRRRRGRPARRRARGARPGPRRPADGHLPRGRRPLGPPGRGRGGRRQPRGPDPGDPVPGRGLTPGAPRPGRTDLRRRRHGERAPAAAAAALPHDGHLVLRRAPDLLRRILEITGLGHQRLVVEP